MHRRQISPAILAAETSPSHRCSVSGAGAAQYQRSAKIRRKRTRSTETGNNRLRTAWSLISAGCSPVGTRGSGAGLDVPFAVLCGAGRRGCGAHAVVAAAAATAATARARGGAARNPGGGRRGRRQAGAGGGGGEREGGGWGWTIPRLVPRARVAVAAADPVGGRVGGRAGARLRSSHARRSSGL